MRDLDELFMALHKSSLRTRQTLNETDWRYLASRSLKTVFSQAADFIDKRLGPVEPRNDGKQTPWRGHAVFTEQQATGTWCRGWLEKRHGIKGGRGLSSQEVSYVEAVLGLWMAK